MSTTTDIQSETMEQQANNRGCGWSRPTEPRHAHFDCFSGAAGDMILAACLDIGGEDLLNHVEEGLRKGLPALKGEFSLHRQRVWRGVGQIAATAVKVTSIYGDQVVPVPRNTEENALGKEIKEGVHSRQHSIHDHSHSHSHHTHEHEHEHAHARPVYDILSVDTSHHYAHNHTTHASIIDHGHSHNHHRKNTEPITHGPMRNLPQIRQMLEEAPVAYIPDWVRRVAILAFELLAQAEAHVHGASSPDAVHFHEVGAVDSIVDTVGSLLALHALGVSTVSCSALPLGTGTVRAAHGLLPVPAPATLFLLKDFLVTAGPPGVTGELVTPTGAALLRALLQSNGTRSTNTNTRARDDSTLTSGRPPRFILRDIGIGAGTKQFDQHPNVLRIMLGDSVM